MTVSYTNEVSTSRGFGCFIKLLARWKGSVYKLVWAELLVFLLLFYTFTIVYNIVDDNSKWYFENAILYCRKYASLIPLSFVLGFYVSLIMSRWWNQYLSIPFPDNLAIIVGACIKGQDERSRIIKRTIVRYVCVAFTKTLCLISPKVKIRFPTHDHYVQAGLLIEEEEEIMEQLESDYPKYSQYWLPLAWAANVTTKARFEGIIRDDESVKMILDEINKFRSKCGGMLDYDWISVPLVYTQVVSIAVYSYFLTSIIGNQYIINTKEETIIDKFFPILPVMEFFFYLGWLKVAETLINPFGEDDDDFEVVWMVDRCIQVVYLIVDQIENPRLKKDKHFSQGAPGDLPFTKGSANFMTEFQQNSTDTMFLKESDYVVLSNHELDGADRGVQRSESMLSRILSNRNHLRQRRLVPRPMRLQTIRINSGQSKKDENTNEYQGEVSEVRKAIDNTDFEKLVTSFQSTRKQKIQKYIQLLQTTSSDLQEKLINDI